MQTFNVFSFPFYHLITTVPKFLSFSFLTPQRHTNQVWMPSLNVQIQILSWYIQVYTTLNTLAQNILWCARSTLMYAILKKKLYHFGPPVLKIIHSLKLVDYLHVQADNQWYKYNLSRQTRKKKPTVHKGLKHTVKVAFLHRLAYILTWYMYEDG